MFMKMSHFYNCKCHGKCHAFMVTNLTEKNRTFMIANVTKNIELLLESLVCAVASCDQAAASYPRTQSSTGLRADINLKACLMADLQVCTFTNLHVGSISFNFGIYRKFAIYNLL